MVVFVSIAIREFSIANSDAIPLIWSFDGLWHNACSLGL
jgi:hypothetical protein